MKSLWEFQGIASLSEDPIVGATKNGKNMVRFRVGCKKDFGDEWNNATIYCYGKLAEFASKYYTKGTKIYVKGSVSAGAYVNKEGKPVGTLNVTATDILTIATKRSDADDSGLNIPEGFTNVSNLGDDGLPF